MLAIRWPLILEHSPLMEAFLNQAAWGTYAVEPRTTHSSFGIELSEYEANESGGDRGQSNCPARISASPSSANSKSVFPEPNLPHMSDNSPSGKFSVRSVKTNFCLGVGATEGAALPVERSCGHVRVQDWSAMVLFCWSRGGMGLTSPPLRYFSIRRRETKL